MDAFGRDHQRDDVVRHSSETVQQFAQSDEFHALCVRALDAAGVAFFLTGAVSEGMPVMWVNNAFAAQTGFQHSDLLGCEPGFLATLVVNPEDTRRMEAHIMNGEPVEETIMVHRRDGSQGWIQLSLTPIREPGQPAHHWVGFQIDVTEHFERYTAQLASLAAERTEKMVLDIVSQSTNLLTDLDQPDALGQIARLLAGVVVTWCAFYLNDDGLRYAVGVDSQAPPSGRGERHGRFAPGLPTKLSAIPRAVGEADDLGDLRTPALYSAQPAVDDPDLVQELLNGTLPGPVELRLGGTYPQYSASGWLLRDLTHRLGVNLPEKVTIHAIPGRTRVLGLFVAGQPLPEFPEVSEPILSEPDVLQSDQGRVDTLLQVIARRAGTAIDNVRLYANEHRLAETLQRAMLPEQADIPGLDVWTYYAPNSEHAQVGGDWYDVLQVGPQTVGLVIGDVVGHDVEAAAAMGQLRSVVRSYAFELATPGRVLDRVDQLVQGMRIPRSASLVYAALTQPGEGCDFWEVEYSRAGHLPPLHLRNGDVTLLDDAGGALIGFGERARRTGRSQLEPGDALVFYTDGLIERRDRSLRTGLDDLVTAAAAITAIDSAGIGEELLSRLAQTPEDDVALVVVRVPDPVADAEVTSQSPRSRRWVLPSEAASIARARHAVVRTTQAWGITDSANAELVVSELVANGVQHGWGHVALRVFDTPAGLRLEVEDSNPTPPVTTDGHAHRLGGFGMQIVSRLAEWGWYPSGPGKVVWAVLNTPTPRPIATVAHSPEPS